MNPRYIAEAFDLGGPIVDIHRYGHGIINDTYRVAVAAQGRREVVLQRINSHVFHRPELIMENLRSLLDHVRERQTGAPVAVRGFRLPEIYTTRDHRDYFVAPEGDFWRALRFIENTHSIDTIADIGQAEEVGFALGRFHRLVHDLDLSRLHQTLPDFHITPRYVQRFNTVVGISEISSPSQELNYCFSSIEARGPLAGVLEKGKRLGLLRVRPIHGDPKLNNVLFDKTTGRASSLIDLDTVQPGLVQYDIGDCLRSCCNIAGETPAELSAVKFDLDICQAILSSYFSETLSFLTQHDLDYLYDAIRLIPFELGIRFITDHLEGNKYFKIREPQQNLRRALTQFKLTADIERQEREIKELIRVSSLPA